MKFFGLIGFLAAGFSCFSQMSLDTIRISQVEIFEDQSFRFIAPASRQLDSARLANFSHAGLGELLETGSGLQVKTNNPGGITTISFRGLSASHTQVNWNGIRLNSPLSGQFDFSLIPVDFIDKVLIRPGNSSLEEQSASLSGSVILKNQIRYDTLLHASFAQEVGSYGKSGSFINLQLGNNWFQSRTKAGIRFAENDFEFLNTAILPTQKNQLIQSAFLAHYLSQEFYFRPATNQQLSFITWYTDNQRELPPHMTRLDDPQYIIQHYSEGLKDYLFTQLAKWEGEKGTFRWNLASGLLLRENQYHLKTTGQDFQVIHESRYINHSNSYHLHGEVEWEPRAYLKVKTDVKAERHLTAIKDLVNNQELFPDRTTLVWTAGVYGRIENGLRIFVLNRAEWNDRQSAGFIPAAGIEYQPKKIKILSLTATVSANYHYPELNDLYFLPGGNSSLKPETGYTAEAGVLLKSDKHPFQANMAFYYSGISDWILWKDTEYGYWTPENLDYVVSKGLEAGISQEYEAGDSKLSWNADYNLSLAQYAGDNENEVLVKGHQLVYVPMHSGHWQASWSYKNYECSVNQQIVGERAVMQTAVAEQSSGLISLDAYYPVSVQLSKSLDYKKMKAFLSFKLSNVLNQHYQVFYLRPMPGIQYSFSFKLMI